MPGARSILCPGVHFRLVKVLRFYPEAKAGKQSGQAKEKGCLCGPKVVFAFVCAIPDVQSH